MKLSNIHEAVKLHKDLLFIEQKIEQSKEKAPHYSWHLQMHMGSEATNVSYKVSNDMVQMLLGIEAKRVRDRLRNLGVEDV